mmetsp:Transcript_80787/g.172777  ORF Transcript_80787/g.172777 Transcript_80787/m.172777 type:complete len:82 (+) Transcript_80787:383-628(+)|eukprot:CAMPEP_0180509178 /NCGR_PEP_ID=MMETSP1036_2-20121128/49579_1 /TAXON_ID=632150 /ORGANISM="Azadinium spinosum, Strain 3D9" /LENGTH=81 /DNA_ID=CAMNT_0022519559 /DNA_START=193 /DNA_END=438 /DNA_ORIENTATION=-
MAIMIKSRYVIDARIYDISEDGPTIKEYMAHLYNYMHQITTQHIKNIDRTTMCNKCRQNGVQLDINSKGCGKGKKSGASSS